MNRRDLVKSLAVTGAVLAAVPHRVLAETTAVKPVFTLPPLGYGYDALEPHIDTKTMTIHHSLHHNGYVKNANGFVKDAPILARKSIDDILSDLSAVPSAVRTGVRNNLGGHYNHTLFWDLMTPGGATSPAGDLKTAIDATFGGTEKMMEQVSTAAKTCFGSGWAWLAVTPDKALTVFSTPNQDTPHMVGNARPILGIDVWEHAYYLKHQNKRGDYVQAWWSVLNWDKAAANFKKATG